MAETSSGADDGKRKVETSSRGDNNGKTETKMESEAKTKPKKKRNPSVVTLAMARAAIYPKGVSSMDSETLSQGLYEGVILENHVKLWVDKEHHKNCLLLLPEKLQFSMGNGHVEWIPYDLKCFGGSFKVKFAKPVGDDTVKVYGSLPRNLLSPMTTYRRCLQLMSKTNGSTFSSAFAESLPTSELLAEDVKTFFCSPIDMRATVLGGIIFRPMD